MIIVKTKNNMVRIHSSIEAMFRYFGEFKLNSEADVIYDNENHVFFMKRLLEKYEESMNYYRSVYNSILIYDQAHLKTDLERILEQHECSIENTIEAINELCEKYENMYMK